MFRITRDPSSGALYSAWLNYSNGSISSVDVDVVGVMEAYSPVVRVCTAQSRVPLFKYFIIILIVSTNYIFVHLLDNKVF